MKRWIPQRAAAFNWRSVGAHPPVEQMYIATGFVTLANSYIQVTARSIDNILFVRALGASIWKQSWLKYFNLNILLFLIQTKFMKEIKKTWLTQTLHRKTLKLPWKIKNIFRLRPATNLASLGKFLRSYFVTIIRTLNINEKGKIKKGV